MVNNNEQTCGDIVAQDNLRLLPRRKRGGKSDVREPLYGDLRGTTTNIGKQLLGFTPFGGGAIEMELPHEFLVRRGVLFSQMGSGCPCASEIRSMCVCSLLVGVASKERVGVLIGNGLQCPFEDEVGCGGVLRDSDGVVRALFSGPVAAKESFTAELSSGFCNGVRVSGVGVKIALVMALILFISALSRASRLPWPQCHVTSFLKMASILFISALSGASRLPWPQCHDTSFLKVASWRWLLEQWCAWEEEAARESCGAKGSLGFPEASNCPGHLGLFAIGPDHWAVLFSFISAWMIPDESEPMLWLTHDEVQQILDEYKKTPKLDCSKKMVNKETYLKERITKAKEQ
ncbi:hypothetical protein J1N35_024149 [Gossypium stocksii]|uniref:Uncharacterized protein n=2 Tax=Gossypium TaxID=3633 RepID=A0A9D3VJU0_9ROSI|nr:hypothetical protein J1N35_024149 [Gossypium stocksii]